MLKFAVQRCCEGAGTSYLPALATIQQQLQQVCTSASQQGAGTSGWQCSQRHAHSWSSRSPHQGLVCRHVADCGRPRTFATAEPPAAQGPPVGNEKVQQLAEDILGLTVLESSWLTEILRMRLNLQKPAFGAMPAFPAGGMPMAGAGSPAAAPAAAAKPAEEKKPEKTEFDVKLESFSPEGKIRVIKEVRAITSLGLKEAKELVEKAPVVIKAGVSKADAENMKKVIETAGGKISVA